MNPPPPPSSETLDLIEKAVTDDFLERLGEYALYKLRGKYWRGVLDGAVPGGLQASDLVHTAIEGVLTGHRRWNSSKDPDLSEYLKSVIDSITSALVLSPENRRSRELQPLEGESEEACVDRIRSRHCYDDPSSSEEDANCEILFVLLDDLKDDQMLYNIVECMLLEQIGKREAIAAHLGIAANDVTQAHKRFARRLPKLRAKAAHLMKPTAA